MNSSAFPPLPRVPFLLIFAPPHPTDPRIALMIGVTMTEITEATDRETATSSPKTSSIAPNPSIPIFIGGAPADLEAVDVGGGGGGGQKKSLCESRIIVGGGMADSATAILSLV